MPKMELGDLESVEAYAQENIAPLMDLIEQGYKLMAPIPSCVLMFKNELPMIMSKNKDIKTIGEAFYDPFEYLMFLNKEGVLKTDFKSINQHVLYHVACHQRVQNIGLQTKKVLSLIPDLDLDVIQRCSGHDGTYGVRVETHTYAVKIGKPIAKKISDKTDLVLSDCVMAGNHIAHISEHKVKAIHPMSLVKIAYGLDKEKT
jgi:Fe-S oxidoreductase